MHTILFDSYRKYQKKNKANVVKAIFKLPLGAILLLVGLGFCLIYTALALFWDFFRDTYFLSLIAEAVLCILIYFYTENFRIKNSDARFYVYQEYCAKMKKWLKQLGVVVTPENIKELVFRLRNEVEKIEKQRASRRECIEKWIQILIIPILLTVFSALIKEQIELTVMLTNAIALLIIFGVIGWNCFAVYSAFDFFRKRKLEQLKSLADDLQGILDCQFENKLFYCVSDDGQTNADSKGAAG